MDLVNISIGNAAITAILGYAVIFLGLSLLMLVILLMGKLLYRKPQAAAAPAEPVPAPAPAPAPVPAAVKAPGAAGELKLYQTDPRDAAMIMAIVADTMGKPLNELRFLSIKEVTEDEV